MCWRGPCSTVLYVKFVVAAVSQERSRAHDRVMDLLSWLLAKWRIGVLRWSAGRGARRGAVRRLRWLHARIVALLVSCLLRKTVQLVCLSLLGKQLGVARPSHPTAFLVPVEERRIDRIVEAHRLVGFEVAASSLVGELRAVVGLCFKHRVEIRVVFVPVPTELEV